jgi:hypothetical protein
MGSLLYLQCRGWSTGAVVQSGMDISPLDLSKVQSEGANPSHRPSCCLPSSGSRAEVEGRRAKHFKRV